MFQKNRITGLLFLAGIFSGSYICDTPTVTWGAVVGLVVSVIAGYFSDRDRKSGCDGLWGFNGILVGCAVPTFLAYTWQMWLLLIFGAAISTWGAPVSNKLLASINLNSSPSPS